MNTPQRYRCHPCGHDWEETEAPAKVKACPVCKGQDFIRVDAPPHGASTGPGRHGRGGRHTTHPDEE